MMNLFLRSSVLRKISILRNKISAMKLSPFVTSVPFSSVSIPADKLLYALQVLAVPDLAHQAPEHIRKNLPDEVAALDIMHTN